jgi:hypothetical protein
MSRQALREPLRWLTLNQAGNLWIQDSQPSHLLLSLSPQRLIQISHEIMQVLMNCRADALVNIRFPLHISCMTAV